MMAASAQAYNAPNVMLMRSDSPSADTLAAMLASCGAQGMQGPRSVGGLEEAVMGGGQNRAFYTMFETSAEETGDDDAADDCAHHVEKKRRLAVDQVRSLEKNFELENKLEPERKMQLARELGLQPRQVAVWFQNRRARWKTKQLERDYDVVKVENEGLKTENDTLKSDLKNVVEKKENLEAEVNNLKAEVLRLKTILQSNLKNFDDQGLETDAVDVGTDLVPRVEMSPKSESPARVQDQPQSQPQHQDDYQQLTTVTTAETATAATVSVHQESPGKSKGGSGGSTSSESNSSEIMNADSPHPIDSVLSPGIDQKASFGCNQLPITTAGQTTSNVDTTLVQFAEELCGGRLVPPQPFQRIAVNHPVKNEDGVASSNVLQEECSTYFYNMDETGPLSWWEWP